MPVFDPASWHTLEYWSIKSLSAAKQSRIQLTAARRRPVVTWIWGSHCLWLEWGHGLPKIEGRLTFMIISLIPEDYFYFWYYWVFSLKHLSECCISDWRNTQDEHMIMKVVNTLASLLCTPWSCNRDSSENGYNNNSVRTLHVNVLFGL